MLKVFGFLVRKPGLERQAFIDHYENEHIPLICRLATIPTVYKRNYVVRGDGSNLPFNEERGDVDFDVVTELVFADRAAFQAWQGELSRPGVGEQVVADEERFLDRSRTRAYVIEEYVTAG
ncbi:EthD domain-containing protein [Chondromyces apiculatus]|uniref:Ethyl tert-butyl ether degradation EthD n=1 Tax=Chondromyces apiculatus DSM 436 TaxID=1192034 RepID=A0A017TGG1_9BACT|nr:EthD domain-containing protein [Chondromyces apiculatus]EYF08334.1 Ethyl tert-butyl ether degradation EthD [Chondromyces apiculatus DSM 436]